jgi:hypothetical protein
MSNESHNPGTEYTSFVVKNMQKTNKILVCILVTFMKGETQIDGAEENIWTG